MQMWGVDLARFQFDRELTWAVVFLNADGTVYGRYGSRRKNEKEDGTNCLNGFIRAARGALELHAAYPGNAKELAGKQPVAVKWPTAEAMPHLKGRKNVVPANGERAACVHCHQAHEGELWSLRAQGDVPERLLWSYPDAETLGYRFDPIERATVTEKLPLLAETPFAPGDRIVRLNGQPILSIADLQWVLHHAGPSGEFEAEVEREDGRKTVRLKLPTGWRRKGDWTWRSIAWSLRHRLAGVEPLEALPRSSSEMEKRAPTMALRVKALSPNWVKDRNVSAAAVLQPGDVIVSVDGRDNLLREADFLAFLMQEKKPGSTVTLSVERKQKVIELKFRLPD